VIGLLEPVAVCPPEDVTVYSVTVLPPLSAGGSNDTVACPLPLTAVTFVGACGTVAGVTSADAVDAAETPTALVAVTVNVYAVPFVNPVTVIGLLEPVAVCPPEDVTIYCVTALPPSNAGVNATSTEPSPAVTPEMTGASGLVSSNV